MAPEGEDQRSQLAPRALSVVRIEGGGEIPCARGPHTAEPITDDFYVVTEDGVVCRDHATATEWAKAARKLARDRMRRAVDVVAEVCDLSQPAKDAVADLEARDPELHAAIVAETIEVRELERLADGFTASADIGGISTGDIPGPA